MYLKSINFMLSILKLHLHMYVLNKNTLQLYFWYIKRLYVKSAKFEQLIFYLMQFNIHLITYLAIKDQYYSKIIQSSSKVTLQHILGLILRNGHCAQVVFQIKFNYNFNVSKSHAIC